MANVDSIKNLTSDSQYYNLPWNQLEQSIFTHPTTEDKFLTDPLQSSFQKIIT